MKDGLRWREPGGKDYLRRFFLDDGAALTGFCLVGLCTGSSARSKFHESHRVPFVGEFGRGRGLRRTSSRNGVHGWCCQSDLSIMSLCLSLMPCGISAHGLRWSTRSSHLLFFACSICGRHCGLLSFRFLHRGRMSPIRHRRWSSGTFACEEESVRAGSVAQRDAHLCSAAPSSARPRLISVHVG